jgi:D-amino peptidase
VRLLLQTDMEGVSRITSYREILPHYDEYWEIGRGRLTDDVLAAVQGLLDGGATEVVVDDQHLGRPENIIWDNLPSRASRLASSVIYQQLREGAFDAVFQVGRHARWGTNDAFVAHTQMPGISLAIDDRLITECHICALRAGAPVLGITGDDRLGPQVDGVISGTPFLPVKQSRSLTETSPLTENSDQSLQTIREFAEHCMRQWRSRPRPTLPESFTLSAFIADSNTRGLAGVHRFTPLDVSTVSVECADWWNDAEPAMQAATGHAAARMIAALGSVDTSSQASMHDIDPQVLATIRQTLVSWLTEPQIAWSATHV